MTQEACHEICKGAIAEYRNVTMNTLNVTLDYYNQTQIKLLAMEEKTSDLRIFTNAMGGAILGIIGGFTLCLFLMKYNPPQYRDINEGGLHA
jgi:hypothetical protein